MIRFSFPVLTLPFSLPHVDWFSVRDFPHPRVISHTLLLLVIGY